MPANKISALISINVFKRLNGQAQAAIVEALRDEEITLEELEGYFVHAIEDGMRRDSARQNAKSTPLTLEFSDMVGQAGSIINGLWPLFIIPVGLALLMGLISKLWNDR